jgi:hypothetical protein
MPFVGFLFGYLMAVATIYRLGPNWYEAGVLGIVTWAGFCVLGLIAAGVAWKRAERVCGITLLGFLLNAPIPLLSLFLFLNDKGFFGL